MQEFWNARYRQEAFAYGEAPNIYFKTQLLQFEPGNILLPAEGEGRNAVFAARSGWKVSAFDISIEGRNKAMRLAETLGVALDYQVGDLTQVHFTEQQFDAVALIYAHFPAHLKSAYHRHFINYLKNDGIVIFEAFSKKHLEYNTINEKVGGPKDAGLLYSTDEIMGDFHNFEILELTETEIELNEGLYHVGLGSVIRFTGRKK
jgi:hypothetical protein